MTPACDQVLVLLGLRVEAEVVLAFLDLLDDDRALVAGVLAIQRSGSSMARLHDVDADLLVAVELEAFERLERAQQRHAAAGHDALLDGRLGRVQRVLDARLLLLHLGLGRRADLDHRHAADELRQPLLQLLAVVVRGRLLDLRADLLDAALDVRSSCRRPRRSSCCPCRS